ncbi:leucine rich repeat protein [Leptospira interrogans serovar Hebdomadis str. R499]|nr:leucine rich repeat protein [Leptospira interrogans serovar Hebdomadis str. R499]
MNFRTTLTYLQRIIISLLFLIYLSCEIQAEKIKPGTYRDLTKALKNPLDVRVLNLSSQKLTTLPKEIKQLQNLKSLDLANNQFKTLPKEIGQLQNLQWLKLNNNQLSSQEEERIQKLLPKCQIYFE